MPAIVYDTGALLTCLLVAGQQDGGAEQVVAALGEELLQVRDGLVGLHLASSLLSPTKYGAGDLKVASADGSLQGGQVFASAGPGAGQGSHPDVGKGVQRS